MPRRPCLEPGCPNLAEPGQSRCARCATFRTRTISRARGSATARGYNSAWARHARSAIASHRVRHGDICPGYRRTAHPITPDQWVCDHDHGPMCRSCNARKAATDDRARAAARRRRP